MTRIRIDTERVREVGRQLEAEGDHLAEIGRELQGAIDGLDTGAWDGASRERAEPLLDTARPQGTRLAEELDRLGRMLVRAADVFEEEDATAARNLTGLPWVDWESGDRAAARPLQEGIPPWVRDGFGWWAEAFEREHGRPPTEEDYREFRLSWQLSGEGQVQWTAGDWGAFYQSRQEGLEDWMALGMMFAVPMMGVQVLAAVRTLNADPMQIVQMVEAESVERRQEIVQAIADNPGLLRRLGNSDAAQRYAGTLLEGVLRWPRGGELLRRLGAGLDDSGRGLFEPHITDLGIGAEVQYNLGRLGAVNIEPVQYNASTYSDLISADPSDPFTGPCITGESVFDTSVPLGDQLGLFLHKEGIVSNPELWDKYYNPIGPLNDYLDGLSAENRRRQVEMLVSQPIFSAEADSYGEALPSRQQIIEVAAARYNIEPELLTAFILAEQRDQSELESAVEYVASVSEVQHPGSIGLGQVTIPTAQNYDLFADLLSEEMRQNLSHNEVAESLASDEINIFATARYIRLVADTGASTAPSEIPDTLELFPGLDLGAYSGHSSTWPDANIRALGSEYTTVMWDNGEQADSPGWGYFVFEAYGDVVSSGVFK